MSEAPKTRSIRRGDRVEIRPEWRDPGDETLAWIACEDEDGGRVLITPVGTGLSFPPRQVVRTDMLYPVLETREFVVFSASEARVSGDNAGFWSNQDGWTTLDGATKFDEAGGLLPISAGNDAVWMPAPYGLSYIVLQLKQETESEPILFDCWAESEKHAQEQAENAYPGCRVLGTIGGKVLKPFKLAVDAYALDEHGDGPGYATVMVTTTLIERIEQLLSVCKMYALESVAVSAGPDEWGNQDELELRGDSLNVWGDGRFWFSARPKHADYLVETRGVDIADLRRIAEAGDKVPTEDDRFQWSNGVLYVSGDAGTVNDLIELLDDQHV